MWAQPHKCNVSVSSNTELFKEQEGSDDVAFSQRGGAQVFAHGLSLPVYDNLAL